MSISVGALAGAMMTVSADDLEIAQECTANAHRLRSRAEDIRASIIDTRRRISETHDDRLRRWLLEDIVRMTGQAEFCEKHADIWANEAEAWESGRN